MTQGVFSNRECWTGQKLSEQIFCVLHFQSQSLHFLLTVADCSSARTVVGFGLDLGGLKTSCTAGRWFSIAFNFLGAGVGAGGARISLHLLHCHSDQNFTLLPLCRSDQIVHSLTLTNSIHCGSGGMGEWRSYISVKGYPLVICGMGEGWSRSRSILVFLSYEHIII